MKLKQLTSFKNFFKFTNKSNYEFMHTGGILESVVERHFEISRRGSNIVTP
jgi:hypothetical protein